MFILTTISDLVQIKPEDFRKKSLESIEDNLNAKYSNKVDLTVQNTKVLISHLRGAKVIQKVGLGICFYDLLKASEGQIGHNNTGTINVNVHFRLLVFRPFRSEIVCGKISSATEHGMKIRLDFFDDIHVPASKLFPGSSFSVKDQCWIWSDEGQDFYFDKAEWVRVRIESEHWHDTAPVEPAKRDETATSERRSPYSITASMSESGLGCVSWW
ncbi:DNA-directed RNA polymerase III subunit rpc25 [Thelotrema lepadinum]|nr:DNA-directed RNA polymerase III subunit rpc25 [Thelotrema lepadinum]